MTLSDGSTRQGTVYSLDPESFTIVLATPTSVRGGVGSNAWKNGEDHRGDPDACVVVPGTRWRRWKSWVGTRWRWTR